MKKNNKLIVSEIKFSVLSVCTKNFINFKFFARDKNIIYICNAKLIIKYCIIVFAKRY